ncbi:hypothetical protein AKJ16_DCAP24592 [Drosera capensis]
MNEHSRRNRVSQSTAAMIGGRSPPRSPSLPFINGNLRKTTVMKHKMDAYVKEMRRNIGGLSRCKMGMSNRASGSVSSTIHTFSGVFRYEMSTFIWILAWAFAWKYPERRPMAQRTLLLLKLICRQDGDVA